MARYGSKTIEKTAKGEFVPYEPLGVTLRRWALQSAEQLRDSYKMQKVFNGSQDKSYEVWRKTKTRRIKGVVKTVSWGWFDESAYREEQQKKRPGSEFWYSTGQSYRIAMGDPVKVLDDTWSHGTIDFTTTTGAYFMALGVGANGRFKSRGKNGIYVDRMSQPYSYKKRYVDKWVPSAGKTHRPNVKTQLNLLNKRIKWLARKHFLLDLATWIVGSMEYMYVDALPIKIEYDVVGRMNVKNTKGSYDIGKK